MKGEADTKYLVKEIYVYSDGSERVVEIRPNPDAEEIVAKVKEAQEEISEVSASDASLAEVDPESVSSTFDEVLEDEE